MLQLYILQQNYLNVKLFFLESYMSKTKHAIKRMQKRGMNDIQVELLEKYGVKKRQKQHWREKNSQAAMVHLNKIGK